MIQEKDLEKLFYKTLVIPPQGEPSVFLGTLLPKDAPSGIDAVMTYYTHFITKLIQSLPLNEAQLIELYTLRCFTYEEYKCLFIAGLKEQDFLHYPIFQTLLITSNGERQLFIRNRDSGYAAYMTLLESWTKAYNPFLHTFIYEPRTNRTDF
jgi:hypothetical protein